MLISRTFGTLLLGFKTTVLGDKLLLSDPSAKVVLRDTPVNGYISADIKPRKHEAMPEIRRHSFTKTTRIAKSSYEQTTERPSPQPRHRRQSEDEGSHTGSTQSVCRGRNDSAINCPEETECCVSPTGEAACCPAAGVTRDESDCVQSIASLPPTAASTDLEINTVTQTSTRTISSFAETRVVVVTSTQLLTFLNPTQRTATSTVTITSFLRRAKRTLGSPSAEITASQTSLVLAHTGKSGPRITSAATGKYMGARAAAEKRQEATLTPTVVVTTTIFVPGVTTRTLTNIVFSTTLAAPNAATTVFVTTTVFRPSSTSSISTIPGVTTPTDPSSPGPTASSTTESSETTSISATDSGDPTGPVPIDSASITTGIFISLFPTNATTTALLSRSSSSAEPETTLPLPEGTMMETMSTSPTLTTTPTPIPNPFTPTQPTLNPAQIAALVLGIVLALLLFIALAFLLRRLVIRRRQKQAKLRQRLSPSPPLMTAAVGPGDNGRNNGDSRGGGTAPAPIVPTGPSSNTSSNYSGLTGEGEVRIVIRPAPKRRTQSSGVGVVWPMPPNRCSHTAGQETRGYSIFMEDSPPSTAIPETLENQKEWSIASERGSLGGGDDQEHEGRREGGAGSVLSSATSGYGYGYSTRGESYPGLGTLLTPPPPPAPLRLKERQEMEQERETEIRGFRTGLLGGRDTTTDGDSGSSQEGTVPPVPILKRPVTRGTEDSGHRADQSESDDNGGASKDSSLNSRKSGNGGGQGGSGTLGKKGSFGLGKGRAW